MRISLDGASKVWIDHNHIQNIGRQFLVNGFNPSTQVSISNDYLDGRATYSTGCDGDHHGVALFSGMLYVLVSFCQYSENHRNW